jgi:hypothetical protein
MEEVVAQQGALLHSVAMVLGTAMASSEQEG